TQIQDAIGVFLQHFTGIGESAIAGRTVEQRFAYFVLQLSHHLAHGRLGPANDLCRAGKAARLNDGQKGFQLKEIHSRSVAYIISNSYDSKKNYKFDLLS